MIGSSGILVIILVEGTFEDYSISPIIKQFLLQ